MAKGLKPSPQKCRSFCQMLPLWGYFFLKIVVEVVTRYVPKMD